MELRKITEELPPFPLEDAEVKFTSEKGFHEESEYLQVKETTVADPGSGRGGAENFSREFADEAKQSQASEVSQY